MLTKVFLKGETETLAGFILEISGNFPPKAKKFDTKTVYLR
jgi:hypothetical protein